MPTKKHLLPDPLDRYLTASSKDTASSIHSFVSKGGSLVTTEAMLALNDMLPELRLKLAGLAENTHLRRRLEILTRYFEETLGDPHASRPARGDTAFALLYFLRGYDRIPDSIPEIGLLDDAMVADTAWNSHSAALRVHWQKYRRAWPEGQ